jgi:hypothetical protein
MGKKMYGNGIPESQIDPYYTYYPICEPELLYNIFSEEIEIVKV